MRIDIVLRLGILRPGIHYGRWPDHPQTEAEYEVRIEWRDEDTTKPTWAEVLAVGDIELVAAKDTKRVEIKELYEAAKEADFTSTASGSPKTYTPTLRNVQYIVTGIAAGGAHRLLCKKPSGADHLTGHTAAQLNTLLDELWGIWDGHDDTALAKGIAINAATTQAELDAITWT